MIILKNPTKNDLSIQFEGREFTIKAESEESIPKEVALYWIKKIHSFLEVVKETKNEQASKPVEPTKQTEPAEPTEPTEPTKPAEPVEPKAPVKEAAKKPSKTK